MNSTGSLNWTGRLRPCLLLLFLAVSAVSAAAAPEPAGWFAGDIHVHRSCGGSPVSLSTITNSMAAQDLAIAAILADMGNGEVQNPATDLPKINGLDDPISTPTRIVHWDAEWHWDATYTQYPHQALGGHLVLLGLTNGAQVWKEYTYPIFEYAHQRGGIAGFAHLQYLGDDFPTSLNCCIPIEYPVEVALGACDFISEDVAGSDTAMRAYYRLLNCGFRPGFAGGSDYPCAAQVGDVLTYAKVSGALTYRKWIEAIAAGRTVVSRNGHNEFLDLKVNTNSTPGDEIQLTNAGNVSVTATWLAKQNLSGTIELVQNGVVVGTLTTSVTPSTSQTLSATVNFTKSGWLAARRMGSGGHKLQTGAVFVKVNNAPIRTSVDDANFYVDWMDNLLQRTSPGGSWESFFTTNRAQAQARYQAAKTLYEQIAAEAGSGGPISMTTTSLPNGVVNGPYAATLAASGGTVPYTWSLTSGSLPPGLTLNVTNGLISGTPTGTGAFNFAARVSDSSNPVQNATNSLSITVTLMASTIWPGTAVPSILSDSDANAVELGVKFRSAVSGYITAIRFYKGSANTGTHVGHLWTVGGSLLATRTFSGETSSGWQQQALTTPVAINSNTTYIVSYHAPGGRYSADVNYFTQGVTNYPLRALSTTEAAGNGVYRYGASGSFPNQTWMAANYWVDVVFATSNAPAASNLVAVTAEDTAANLALVGSDAEGPVTFSIVSNPTNGLLSAFNTNSGAITYTPGVNYNGPDLFRYRVSDGSLFATGQVSITVTPVNDAPSATDFIAVTPEDTATNLVLFGTDVDGPVTFSIVSNPTNGLLSAFNTNSGAITYTPGVNYNGPDLFRYRVSDGSLFATGQVSITVTPVNDAPSATDLVVVTPEDTATNLVLLGSDVEGPVTFSIVSGPTNGLLSNFDTNSGAITYTPNLNYSGPDAFSFAVSDGSLYATGQVSIIVTPVNDTPFATDLVVVTPEDTATNLVLLGGDVEGPATFSIVSGPTNGLLSSFDTNSGAITYTPGVDYHGADSFSFAISDGGLSATGQVSITVTPVNDAPIVANPIAGQTGIYGAALSFQFNGNTFTDVDGDTLAYNASGMPPGITFDDSTRTFSGTPGQTGEFDVEVVSTDDGTPQLSATNEFNLSIAKAGAIVVLESLNQTYAGTAREVIAATTPEGLPVVVTYNGGDSPPTNAGNYQVVGEVAETNYTGCATNTLTVLPAPLTVTADSKAKAYGEVDPVFTANYAGFVGSDDESVLGGTLLLSRSPGETAGVYPISPSGLTSGNYAISFVDGTLTISNAYPVILSVTGAGTTNLMLTWSALSNVTYRVQYQQSILANTWSNLAPDILATSNTASAIDDSATGIERYYRVQVLPREGAE